MKVVLRDDVDDAGPQGRPRSTSPTATPATTWCRAGSAMRRPRASCSRPRRCAATARPARSRDRARAEELAQRLVGDRASRSRRGPARAASCSARSPSADIVDAVLRADRRRARPAQDHARRAAQGARPGRGAGRSCTPTSRSLLARRGRRRVDAPRAAAPGRMPSITARRTVPWLRSFATRLCDDGRTLVPRDATLGRRVLSTGNPQRTRGCAAPIHRPAPRCTRSACGERRVTADVGEDNRWSSR